MSNRTNRVTSFVDQLVDVIDSVGTNQIKIAIGDSINNNRTLTVNQLIRYLTTRRNPSLRTLGNQLTSFYTVNRVSILSFERGFGLTKNRTDAIEVSELVNYVRELAAISTRFNRSSAQVLNKAA